MVLSYDTTIPWKFQSIVKLLMIVCKPQETKYSVHIHITYNSTYNDYININILRATLKIIFLTGKPLLMRTMATTPENNINNIVFIVMTIVPVVFLLISGEIDQDSI